MMAIMASELTWPLKSSIHAESPYEITPEMLDAGAEALLGELGGADLGGYFSPNIWQGRFG